MKRTLSLLLAATTAVTTLVVVGFAGPAAAAIPPNDTTYMLVNDKSARCLDQNYSGGNAHSDVIAYACGVDDNQKWTIWYDTGKGKYAIVNDASLKCLDQDYSGGTMHTGILAYTCQPNSQLETSISNQLWWLDPV